MGVDVAHLVLEALGDTGDHVLDDRADGAEGSDVLAGAMVELDVDDVLLGDGEGDRDVAEVLDELACSCPSIPASFNGCRGVVVPYRGDPQR